MKKHLVIGFISGIALLSACGGSSGSGGSTNDMQYPGPGYDGVSQPNTNLTRLDAPSGNNGGPTSGPVTARFYLTDAPNPEIDSAVVTISDVSVHKTGGAFFSVLSEPVTLDLLDLQNGVTALLGEIVLEPGKYTQIRLTVDEAVVTSGEDTYEVTVPSGEIKIVRPFDVCDGGSDLEITIDFDAKKSLKYNPGKDGFIMKPVVKILEASQECPAEDGAEEGDDCVGPTGWLSIVLPPVDTELLIEASATVDDIQVHDQGIGQVSTFAESYDADLLEAERQVADETTGEIVHTILVPPVEVPAGDLDQVRLFFQPIIVTDADGNSIALALPDEDQGDGLKFFDTITVCENALTVLQWDLHLDSSLDLASGEPVRIHPVIQSANVIVTCEPIEGSDTAADDPEECLASDDDEDSDADESDDDDDDGDGDDDDDDSENGRGGRPENPGRP